LLLLGGGLGSCIIGTREILLIKQVRPQILLDLVLLIILVRPHPRRGLLVLPLAAAGVEDLLRGTALRLELLLLRRSLLGILLLSSPSVPTAPKRYYEQI